MSRSPFTPRGDRHVSSPCSLPSCPAPRRPSPSRHRRRPNPAPTRRSSSRPTGCARTSSTSTSARARCRPTRPCTPPASRAQNGLKQAFPPNTGVGWYTLATGTWPGEHGSTNNTFHRTGEGNFNDRTGLGASIVQADTIQQAAERDGLKVASVEWVGSRTHNLAGPVDRLPQLLLDPRRARGAAERLRAGGRGRVRRVVPGRDLRAGVGLDERPGRRSGQRADAVLAPGRHDLRGPEPEPDLRPVRLRQRRRRRHRVRQRAHGPHRRGQEREPGGRDPRYRRLGGDPPHGRGRPDRRASRPDRRASTSSSSASPAT